MDAHLQEEDIDVNNVGWSFTSKALLLSNVLVSILIVVVMSFIFFSSGIDVTSEPGSNAGIQANVQGEFANEKPSNPVKQNENKDDDEPVVNEAEEISDEIVEDPEEVAEDEEEILGDIDPQVLQIVEGCLSQQVTGQQCDETFVRDDIIDFCDESEVMYDRCYVMAALMNTEIEYCDFVEGEVLADRCFEALNG